MKKIFTLFIFYFINLYALEAEKITLLLDWYLNPNHAPLYVAQKFGFFKKHNIEIDIITPPDYQLPAKLVAAGKADLAISYQYHLHLLVNQSLPLTRIATLIDTPLNALAVKENGPIKKIQDLKGKRIGFSVGLGSSKIFIQTMLEKAGLKLEDVQLIRSNQSMKAAFLANQLEAITGIYRNIEFYQLKQQNTPLRLFYYEDYGIPTFDELIVVANRNHLTSKNYLGFIQALEDAISYLGNHSEECFMSYLKDYPEQNTPYLKEIWKDTLSRLSLNLHKVDDEKYNKMALFLKDKGLVHHIPALSTYSIDIKKASN